MTSEETTVSENFVEDGKNKTKLFCERCNSTVLLPMKAVYCEVEVILVDFSWGGWIMQFNQKSVSCCLFLLGFFCFYFIFFVKYFYIYRMHTQLRKTTFQYKSIGLYFFYATVHLIWLICTENCNLQTNRFL